jgi:GNAT superfamily N-acetyltransferase
VTASTVRAAKQEDAWAIARVHVCSWQVAYRGLVPDGVLDGLSIEHRERIWRKLLSESGGASFTLVAERDGGVAGFCHVAAPSRDDDASDSTCEVTAIYVDPDAWRAGVGRALLDTALSDVRQDGWEEATLWVFAQNVGAHAFYERFGFTRDGAEVQHEPSGQIEVRLRASLRGEPLV